MKKLIILLLALLWFTSASAGDWVRGTGETLNQATQDAINNALRIVRHQGSGCLGSKEGDLIRVLEKEDELFVIEAFYSHSDDSCGEGSRSSKIKSAFIEIREELP